MENTTQTKKSKAIISFVALTITILFVLAITMGPILFNESFTENVLVESFEINVYPDDSNMIGSIRFKTNSKISRNFYVLINEDGSSINQNYPTFHRVYYKLSNNDTDFDLTLKWKYYKIDLLNHVDGMDGKFISHHSFAKYLLIDVYLR